MSPNPVPGTATPASFNSSMEKSMAVIFSNFCGIFAHRYMEAMGFATGHPKLFSLHHDIPSQLIGRRQFAEAFFRTVQGRDGRDLDGVKMP